MPSILLTPNSSTRSASDIRLCIPALILKSFLAARTARLLILAGTDRLDKELMIGQMQGKFQMEVVPGVGHMVQEV